jgi:hypothetical protein
MTGGLRWGHRHSWHRQRGCMFLVSFSNGLQFARAPTSWLACILVWCFGLWSFWNGQVSYWSARSEAETGEGNVLELSRVVHQGVSCRADAPEVYCQPRSRSSTYTRLRCRTLVVSVRSLGARRLVPVDEI